MQRTTQSPVALLLIAVALACGCSRQKTLADRFSHANRAIVVDRTDSNVTMPLTGEETRNLLRAISASRKESPLIEASAQLRIEFFKGTNFLGAVEASGVGVFGVDGVPYSDRSGVLQTLATKFSQEQAARKSTNTPAR